MGKIIQFLRYMPKYIGVIMALIEAISTITDQLEKVNQETKQNKDVK